MLSEDSGQPNAVGVLDDPWYSRQPSGRRRIATGRGRGERLPRTEALQKAAQQHGFIHEVSQAVITVSEDVGRVRQMACMAGR